MAGQGQYRLKDNRLFHYADGKPTIDGPNMHGRDLSDLEELPDEVAMEVIRTFNARPEEQARVAASPNRAAPQGEPRVDVGETTITERKPMPAAPRIDARARPSLSPEEMAEESQRMVAGLDRSGGQTGGPPGVMGLAARTVAGAAQGAGSPFSTRGQQPQDDAQMNLARLGSAAGSISARLNSAMDPLKAALLGERDDGSNRRRLVAEQQARDPVERLSAERRVAAQLQAQRDRADPNSDVSVRLRELMAGGDPVREKALEGQSAAELEKFAPMLVKQMDAQMAREAREGAREDAQRHAAEQAELNRQNSRGNAYIAAGLGQQRADAAENRAIAREDRGVNRKKEQQTLEIEERYRGADKALEDMEKMVQKKGTFETFGDHNALLEALITSYATDMAKMRDADSVAREGEVALERKALGDFNGMGTSNQTALDIIKKTRERLAERRGEAYRVRGMDLPGVPTSPSTGGVPQRTGAAAPRTSPPVPGMVRIRDPNTGRTGWANPDAVPPGAEVLSG